MNWLPRSQLNPKRSRMNKNNMHDALKIVNNRVANMLNSSAVNNEVFFRDVRTLTELIDYQLENEDEDEVLR
jgi:hypothetical protein